MPRCVIVNDLPELIPALINKGADAGARDNRGNTMLAYACGFYEVHEVHRWLGCQREAVQILVESGADVNARADRNGMTALMVAARSQCSESILRCLLDNGAHVNAKDDDGRTALSYAWGSEAKKLLRKRGAIE